MSSTKNLDIELGALHKPAQVRHLFGRSAADVRRMCVDGEIECVITVGPNGQHSYWISDNAIRAWRKTHTKKSS